MYNCQSCGNDFDEPDTRDDGWWETVCEHREWYPWHVAICPICGSEDIEKENEDG